MPKITTDRIVFLPEDRYVVQEQSPAITAAEYTALFNNAIQQGDTTKFFKFLEEIAEKDPDILQALSTRTAMVTSKDWYIEGDSEKEALAIEDMLRDIEGIPSEGLLSTDEMISSLLGSSYLVGLSLNEIVTDDEKILGFNPIPSHFLTFYDAVHYPNLWTQEKPTGAPFNKDKMINHYLVQGIDPTRGWLGNCIGWLYVFKRALMDAKIKFQGKYGKGFLLINMPGEKDSYLAAWTTAEELIENYSSVDGAVFPADVTIDFKESASTNGDYFFTAADKLRSSIVKVILGQDSTSSAEDSNRSTAEVHMEVLEQRIIDDINAIESTLTNQLLPQIKRLLGVGEDSKYQFKFEQSDMEETLDDEQVTPETPEKSSTPQEPTPDVEAL